MSTGLLVNVKDSYRKVVSICDSELLGKRFEEEKFQLDIKESFYKGQKVSEKEAIKLMQKMEGEDATFNIVGEKSVSVALKVGIISGESVRTIQGIPFALVLM